MDTREKLRLFEEQVRLKQWKWHLENNAAALALQLGARIAEIDRLLEGQECRLKS